MTRCSTCQGIGEVLEEALGRWVKCPSCEGYGLLGRAAMPQSAPDDTQPLEDFYRAVNLHFWPDEDPEAGSWHWKDDTDDEIDYVVELYRPRCSLCGSKLIDDRGVCENCKGDPYFEDEWYGDEDYDTYWDWVDEAYSMIACDHGDHDFSDDLHVMDGWHLWRCVDCGEIESRPARGLANWARRRVHALRVLWWRITSRPVPF